MNRPVRRRAAVVMAGALVLALTGGCGGGAEPSVVRLTEEDAGTTVALAVGDSLVVTLESNASTGYAWEVVAPLPESLEQEGEPEYFAPEDQDVVGAPGAQEFTFAVVSAGTGALDLAYVRPWEEDVEPEATYEVTIEVS
jgi:inhibitor of cysteine peptidase